MTFLTSSLPPTLLSAIFWIAALGCAVAQFYIIRAVVRVAPLEAPVHDVPAPHRPVEIFWAVLPALMLVGAFVGAWLVMHPSDTASPDRSPSVATQPLTPTP